MASDAWLVVGLGNPGLKYETTRHNVGQMALDVLAGRIGGSFSSHKTGARILEGRIVPGGPKYVLAKPNSFMNLSGGPVSSLSKFFGITPDRIIVLHDELDIPFNSVKLKSGGGHGGHNGLRDIAKSLGTPDFIRVRIGVGRPAGRQDPADFVLSSFAQNERADLGVTLEIAADATERIVQAGLIQAQQEFHGKGN